MAARSANEADRAQAQRDQPVEFVMVAGNYLTLETLRQGQTEAVGEGDASMG